MIRYLILAEPRTGSALLADYLTGARFGWPREYYGIKEGSHLRGQGLIDAFTAGGIFGIKTVQPHHAAKALEELDLTHVIRLTRRDRNAQIMSLARASVSTVWHVEEGDDYTPPEVTGMDRRHARSRLTADAKVLAQLDYDRLPVLYIDYEGFMGDKLGTLRTIARFLGEPAPALLPTTTLREMPK